MTESLRMKLKTETGVEYLEHTLQSIETEACVRAPLLQRVDVSL